MQDKVYYNLLSISLSELLVLFFNFSRRLREYAVVVAAVIVVDSVEWYCIYIAGIWDEQGQTH